MRSFPLLVKHFKISVRVPRALGEVLHCLTGVEIQLGSLGSDPRF